SEYFATETIAASSHLIVELLTDWIFIVMNSRRNLNYLAITFSASNREGALCNVLVPISIGRDNIAN
ncbi:MAG: hypothetical protein RIS16_490, partial [Actinomycetota bacterium]